MTRYGWLFWFPLVALIAVVVYELLLFRKRKLYRHKKKDTAAKIAHTKFVRNLPEYKRARRRYNTMLVIAAIFYLAAGSSLTFLSARPISVTESKEEKENRDIMFCLDVSGSMQSYVEGLSDAFIDLVKKMKGERFGITIFDGEYATLSPLSDEYDSLLDLLEELKDNRTFSHYSSTLNNSSFGFMSGTSEIGAGLVGCVDSFDRLDEVERSRVIILATDNFGPTTPIVTLTQAGQYAVEKDITVYGMNIADGIDQSKIDDGSANNKYRNASAVEFQDVTIATGGSYYAINGKSAASSRIIGQIMSQEAARYEGAGQLIRNDDPKIPAIISTVLLVLLVIIIWRLYL